ncbi:beta-2-glycoprotein 1-like [Parambassis ranga]|uniref:Beta-2-glycoprotein 1 n=1 Tax=Parambassis ranga TaxID=210632 RepID=A0A6P7J9I3_9TELE|nr:beta-2-glycoprotein 1-like [Parambassis ranga]
MELLLFLLCLFLSFTPAENEAVCSRPQLGANVEIHGLQRIYSPGAELRLSCEEGYTPVFGPHTIVCGASGAWTATKLICTLKRCPYPNQLLNGEMLYDDTTYRSVINYTCHEGYILTGSSSAVCQANATWSSDKPECRPVTCGLAPIPEFGGIIYDRIVRGNTTEYGTTVTYKCLPPYASFGNAEAKCTASGTWTKTPTCQVVTCPPPKNIERGYMSNNDQRNYDYMETIKYGCTGDYELEGSQEVFCQKDGTWSARPSCMAPCRVDIQRGRILYKGEKIWIKNFEPNKVLHKEIVSVYCMNEDRNCGYAIPTQCIDGRLQLPECFKEPSDIAYKFNSGSLPSEIEQC